MHTDRIMISLSAWVLIGSVGGCTANIGEAPDVPGAPTPRVSDAQVSVRARVNFKGGTRYATLLSQGLSLDRDLLCQELGRYDCVRDVHRITLGGVDPYQLGVMESVTSLGVTAPIAVERVALRACLRRVKEDFDTPNLGKIFHRAPSEAIDTLYRRILQRRPESHETEALLALRGELSDRDWATASCLAVTTTMEALFY